MYVYVLSLLSCNEVMSLLDLILKLLLVVTIRVIIAVKARKRIKLPGVYTLEN